MAHIFNRIYQAEDDRRCRDAAVAWFERSLAMRRPGAGAGGFLAMKRPDPNGPLVWEPILSFLDGAVGVALALLSAVAPVAPHWDRLIAASGRAR